MEIRHFEYLVIQNKLCGPSIVQQPETCQKPTSNQPQWVSVKKAQINGISSTILIHGWAGNINDLPILTEITRGWSYSKFSVGLWLLHS